MFLLWLRQLPHAGIGPLPQFPHPPRAGSVLLTLLFFPLVPSSYKVLCGSTYSFPLVTYSCRLSACVLHVLLCLKAYSWCVCGDRFTPCSPAPPSSCSPSLIFFFFLTCKCLDSHPWKTSWVCPLSIDNLSQLFEDIFLLSYPTIVNYVV